MSSAPQPLAEATVLARTYQVLARAFDYPTPELWEALEGFGPEGAGEALGRRSQEEREADYLALFEIGGVPLYEGLCFDKEGRQGILEDLLRFYHFFGLRLSKDAHDFPDHLSTELEFMSYLLTLEEQAKQDGRDTLPFHLAQRDFLIRHLARWVPEFCARVDERAPSSGYRQLASWLESMVSNHCDDLESILGQSMTQPSVVAKAFVEGARP